MGVRHSQVPLTVLVGGQCRHELELRRSPLQERVDVRGKAVVTFGGTGPWGTLLQHGGAEARMPTAATSGDARPFRVVSQARGGIGGRASALSASDEEEPPWEGRARHWYIAPRNSCDVSGTSRRKIADRTRRSQAGWSRTLEYHPLA